MIAEENVPRPHYQMIYFEASSVLAGPCLVYNRIRLLHLIICFGFAPTAKLLIKLSMDLNGSFLHIILRGHARSIFKYIPIKCIKLILADLHTLLIRMFINNLLKITAGDGVDITSSGKETFCGEVLLPSRASRTYSLGEVVSLTIIKITIVIL